MQELCDVVDRIKDYPSNAALDAPGHKVTQMMNACMTSHMTVNSMNS